MERCPSCGRKRRRSHRANAAYWGLLHEIAETLRPNGAQYGPEAYHLLYRQRFLGADDVRLPSGQVLTIPKSTANLDADEFSAYLSKVEADAAERGVFMDEMT